MSPYPFRRLLVVNSQPEPDAELLRYAAALKCTSPEAEVLLASAAGERIMRDLAPLARATLGSGDTRISFRVLLESHLDLLFDLATDWQADLIVARRPEDSSDARLVIRQLLFEAPCAVCLVPKGVRASARRPLVRLETTPRGARLLNMASALARHTRSEDLIALHTYFHDALLIEPDMLRQLRMEREMELYRFLARADLNGVNCTPLLEENPSQISTLLRVAEQRQADLVVFDPTVDQIPVWQWNRRQSEALARSARIPILSAHVPSESRKMLRGLREHVFTEMEVPFN